MHDDLRKRRTAPWSTRCLQHSMPSDGDEVAAVGGAGGIKGGVTADLLQETR